MNEPTLLQASYLLWVHNYSAIKRGTFWNKGTLKHGMFGIASFKKNKSHHFSMFLSLGEDRILDAFWKNAGSRTELRMAQILRWRPAPGDAHGGQRAADHPGGLWDEPCGGAADAAGCCGACPFVCIGSLSIHKDASGESCRFHIAFEGLEGLKFAGMIPCPISLSLLLPASHTTGSSFREAIRVFASKLNLATVCKHTHTLIHQNIHTEAYDQRNWAEKPRR